MTSNSTPDLIPLMGARMVRASEPEQCTRLQEGAIKELTGGEPLLARALHSEFIEVTPETRLQLVEYRSLANYPGMRLSRRTVMDADTGITRGPWELVPEDREVDEAAFVKRALAAIILRLEEAGK